MSEYICSSCGRRTVAIRIENPPYGPAAASSCCDAALAYPDGSPLSQAEVNDIVEPAPWDDTRYDQARDREL